MKRIILILAIIGLLVSTSMGSYTIGDTVRNFTLNDCNGNPVNLYDYYWKHNGGTGYVVLINFGEPW